MIDKLIEHLVVVYPTELSTAANMIALTWPFLLICAIVWLLAVIGEAWIDWSERRRITRAQRLRYRTADDKRMEREIEQLWRQTPDASGAFWQPWRDTMPPAEPVHRNTANAGRVVPFPQARQEPRP